MSRPDAFARRWWKGCRFTSGDGGVSDLGQTFLPDGPVPPTHDGARDYALGLELGQAYLKLRRPCPLGPEALIEPDPAPDYLHQLSSRIGYGPSVASLRLGFFEVVDGLADCALHRPEALRALTDRLDRLQAESIAVRIAWIVDLEHFSDDLVPPTVLDGPRFDAWLEMGE